MITATFVAGLLALLAPAPAPSPTTTATPTTPARPQDAAPSARPQAPAAAAPALKPDPAEVIRRADEALRAAPSLVYVAESQPFGAAVAVEPSVRGRAVIRNPLPGKPNEWTLAIGGAINWPGAMEGSEFRIVGDDEEVWSTRSDRLELKQGFPADTEGLLDDGGRFLAWWLVAWPEMAARPALEPGPVTLSWEGRRLVDGVQCDVIRFDASAIDTIETDSWWFIAQTDHLPRRIDRLLQTPSGAGIVSLVLAGVRAGGEIDRNEFKKTLPVGYQSIEYAPAPVAARTPLRGRGLLPVGALTPDFSLATPTGQQRRLSDARGRTIVLAFWASWSKPSVAMLKGLRPILERFKDRDITTWALSTYEHGDAEAVFAPLGLPATVLLDADSVARRLGVLDLPTIIVIGPDGRAVHVATSGDQPSLDAVAGAIDKALSSTK